MPKPRDFQSRTQIILWQYNMEAQLAIEPDP